MTKLNIYLLKENVTDEQVLKLIPGVTKVECLKENARIYTYTPSSSVPKWVTPYFGTVYEDLKIKHVGVINIVDVEIDGRIVSFLLSFGSTKAVVNNSCIVENFGMKTLLSSSDKFNFKNLVVYGCADNKKKFNTQLSSADNIFDFGVDVINNLITKITASVPDDENLKYTMVGSDSLNLSSKNCLDDIEELLIKLYEYYISDKYVSKYKFIDNIRLVNDKHIKEKLNQELLNILNKSLKEDDYSLVEMITPVLIDWENISGYSYIRGKIYDELDLKTFFRDKKVKEVTSSTLESTIKLISSEDESIIDSWKLYKCLF